MAFLTPDNHYGRWIYWTGAGEQSVRFLCRLHCSSGKVSLTTRGCHCFFFWQIRLVSICIWLWANRTKHLFKKIFPMDSTGWLFYFHKKISRMNIDLFSRKPCLPHSRIQVIVVDYYFIYHFRVDIRMCSNWRWYMTIKRL